MTNPAILEALARAIHCHDGRLPTPWDADMIARWPDDCEYERKVAMSQAAAVLELVGPRELAWDKHDYGTTTAKAQVGVYRVCEPNSGGIWSWWLYSWWPRSGCILAEGTPQGYPSLEAAQAAAQAHADAAHWKNTKIGGSDA